MGFTCAVCGRFHEEEPRDIRLTYPGPVARLARTERERWVVASEDFCTLAAPSGPQRHFARGLVEIPIPEEADTFAYGTWVELDEQQVARLAELWRDPRGYEEPPFHGALANDLTPYVGTEGLPATLRLGDVERLPLIELEGEHRLVRDVRGGISAERARELAGAVLHPA